MRSRGIRVVFFANVSLEKIALADSYNHRVIIKDHPVEVHVDDLGTYRIDVNVEFCPRRPVAKSLALSMHLSHGGVAESTSNCSAHDGKTCNVLCQFRVNGE